MIISQVMRDVETVNTVTAKTRERLNRVDYTVSITTTLEMEMTMTLRIIDGIWTAFSGEQPIATFYDLTQAIEAMAYVQAKLDKGCAA
jgi:hypothetical protein